MDTWYATADMMQHINKRGKIFYCPIEDNRHVVVTCQYQRADSVEWNETDLAQSRFCRLKGLDKKINVKL